MTTQNQGDKHFETLLALYLKQSQVNKNSNPNQLHLDEDILSAFIEGTLVEKQGIPVLRHLVACGFCRRVTMQLAELCEDFNDTRITSNVAKTNIWRELWTSLTESASRAHDNAVVAHEEDELSEDKRKDEPDKNI